MGGEPPPPRVDTKQLASSSHPHPPSFLGDALVYCVLHPLSSKVTSFDELGVHKTPCELLNSFIFNFSKTLHMNIEMVSNLVTLEMPTKPGVK